MQKMIHKILRLILPKWLADDIYNRFTHPYWFGKEIKGTNLERTQSVGITRKIEITSCRRPFKRINRTKVLKYLKDTKVETILDIGCGVGNLVKQLNEEGFQAYGITINPEEIEKTVDKNIFIHDIQSGSVIRNIDIKQFDAIVSFDCLEHLESPLIALKNINKLLKLKGLFISYIPPERWIECDYHIIVYTPKQFKWLLNLSGFGLIEKEGKYKLTKKGVTYYAIKIKESEIVYPGVLE